jgi:hypothetical protein
VIFPGTVLLRFTVLNLLYRASAFPATVRGSFKRFQRLPTQKASVPLFRSPLTVKSAKGCEKRHLENLRKKSEAGQTFLISVDI